MSANVKMALFYDWLFFHPSESIMNIGMEIWNHSEKPRSKASKTNELLTYFIFIYRTRYSGHVSFSSKVFVNYSNSPGILGFHCWFLLSPSFSIDPTQCCGLFSSNLDQRSSFVLILLHIFSPNSMLFAWTQNSASSSLDGIFESSSLDENLRKKVKEMFSPILNRIPANNKGVEDPNLRNGSPQPKESEAKGETSDKAEVSDSNSDSEGQIDSSDEISSPGPLFPPKSWISIFFFFFFFFEFYFARFSFLFFSFLFWFFRLLVWWEFIFSLWFTFFFFFPAPLASPSPQFTTQFSSIVVGLEESILKAVEKPQNPEFYERSVSILCDLVIGIMVPQFSYV